MGYECCLTTQNIKEIKDRIVELYQVARKTDALVCFAVCLQFMFEFLCAYNFKDTNDDVRVHEVLKRFCKSSEDTYVMYIWKSVRDSIAHNNVSYIDMLFLKKIKRISESNLNAVTFFDNAEEDKDLFIKICKECCEALMNTKGLQAVQSFS